MTEYDEQAAEWAARMRASAAGHGGSIDLVAVTARARRRRTPRLWAAGALGAAALSGVVVLGAMTLGPGAGQTLAGMELRSGSDATQPGALESFQSATPQALTPSAAADEGTGILARNSAAADCTAKAETAIPPVSASVPFVELWVRQAQLVACTGTPAPQ